MIITSRSFAIDSHITAVWANEGGDKVSQDELRATRHQENHTGQVLNRAWDGTTIRLSGAQNEEISFNLVIEAGGAAASNVAVSFDTLTGPGGTVIHSAPASGNGVFDWTNRPIELFFVRYLQIRGLSFYGYNKWDERQVPVRFQRPYTGAGVGTGGWTDRPDHDKYYPDPLVPSELVPTFNIASGTNQSIWSDIYIPKSIPAGIYTGSVYIREGGIVTKTIPVSLSVRNFALPDQPSAKTMAVLSPTDVLKRYVSGGSYINWASSEGQRAANITDKHFQLFHRHKIALLGENECPVFDHPCDSSLARLNGSLFTASHGYDGPGVGQPTGVFSIGTYGTWGAATYGIPAWKHDEALFHSHIDGYERWFQQNLPTTDRFLYLEDEPPAGDFPQVETWAHWIHEDLGPGHNLKSFATTPIAYARTEMPDIDLPTQPANVGNCPLGQSVCDNTSVNQSAADYYSSGGRKLWAYNDGRPAVGSSMTEDDGTAMRVLGWAQFKKGIDRWFYWYVNPDQPQDWYSTATTWGSVQFYDSLVGWTGNDATSNGNGLLVYPGSDLYNPNSSYNVDGPIASLRLKEWRRGVEDVDYLTLAKKYDPQAVQAIVNRIVPKVLWEYTAPEPTFYTGGGQSWSSDPDVWEQGRSDLAAIISAHCAATLQSTEPDSPCVYVSVPPSNTETGTGTGTGTGSGGTDHGSDNNALRFIPLTPCRVLDTRLPAGDFGGPALASAQKRDFTLPNGACGVPANAQAYSVNVTVVPHGQLQWLVIWPTGQSQPQSSTINSYDGRVKAAASIVAAGLNGGISAWASQDTDVLIDINGYFIPRTEPDGLAFYPLTPCRAVDTRLTGTGTLGAPFVSGHETRTFTLVEASCGLLPGTALAYSLNLTAIPKSKLGWLTIWPTGWARPDASTLNAPTGAVTANAAITPVGPDGQISVYSSDDTDLLIDVNGYFAPPSTGGLSLYTTNPCRAFDTRGTVGAATGAAPFDFSASTCQVPSSATAMVLNATTVPSPTLSYLSLWPAEQSQPTVSTLNAYDGQVTSNLAIVPASTAKINAFLANRAQLIFDVLGYFAP